MAFAHSASPDEVKLVETWPKGSTGGGTSDQVPTELYYSDPITRKKTWGYEAAKPSKGVDVLKWFKLLLQGSGHGCRPS